MYLHRYVIKTKSRKFRIRPFGDLQKGDKGFRTDLYSRFLREVREDKDSYVIGMGDYSNSFRPTIQRELHKAFTKDTEAHCELDYMIMKEMDELAKDFEPFKHRIIGLCEGHHFHRMVSGITSTQYLCQKLGVKYLGFVGIIQLVVMRGTPASPSTTTIEIFATHGCGGSKHSYSDMSKLEREIVPFWDCDIFLRGHSTKVYVAPAPPLNKLTKRDGGTEPKIVKRNRWLVNTGGFMEGYVPNQTGYVEEQNMPPCALGWAVLDVSLKDTSVGKISGTLGSSFEISPSVVAP